MDVAPAWAEELPKGFDKVIDKKKTGKNQEKTPEGKPKMGLQDPVNESEECKQLWAELRDALESWYILQKTPQSTPDEIKSIKESLGTTDKAFGDFVDNHTKRKKKDPAHFGDKDKLAKYIKELLGKYEKCLKPGDEKPKDEKKDDDKKPKKEKKKVPATGLPIPNPSDINLPTVPGGPCWTPAEKNAYDQKADAASNAISIAKVKVKQIIAQLTPMGVQQQEYTPEAQKELDAAEAVLKKLEKLSSELDQLNADADKKVCKEKTTTGGEGGGIGLSEETITERPLTETISVITGTDSEVWCTFGDGVGLDTTIIETDENGIPITEETTTASEEATTISEGKPTEAEGTPIVPETPELTEKVPEQPPTTPETPELTEEVPEQPPSTPETPELTEKVPEQPPSEIPDTIFVKVEEKVLKELKEAVLKGQPPGNPMKNQVVRLFPPDEPDLPGTGIKETEDTGFDKDPVQCTTGADGECKMQVPAEDRALYDLPSTGENTGHYRLDHDLPQQSGGVAETTDESTKPDLKKDTPDGAEVTEVEFKIGDRTFVRLVYKLPYGVEHDFDEQYTPTYGSDYEEDYCRVIWPGPPLGMQSGSLSSLNHNLPEATVKLGGAVSAPGDTR